MWKLAFSTNLNFYIWALSFFIQALMAIHYLKKLDNAKYYLLAPVEIFVRTPSLFRDLNHRNQK